MTNINLSDKLGVIGFDCKMKPSLQPCCEIYTYDYNAINSCALTQQFQVNMYDNATNSFIRKKPN